MAIGRNLKALRLEKNWTQGDLSEKTGIKVAHISKLENNDGDPKLSTLEKLIDALGCDADELLFDKSTSGLTSVIKYYLKKILELRAVDKGLLIQIMDKFFMADAINTVEQSGTPTHILDELARQEYDEKQWLDKMIEEEQENERNQQLYNEQNLR